MVENNSALRNYLSMLCAVNRCPASCVNLILAFTKIMVSTDEGFVVILDDDWKEQYLSDYNYRSMKTLNQQLKALIRTDLIRPIDDDMYIIDYNVFYDGKWLSKPLKSLYVVCNAVDRSIEFCPHPETSSNPRG